MRYERLDVEISAVWNPPDWLKDDPLVYVLQDGSETKTVVMENVTLEFSPREDPK